jgi:hypothetical protein
MYKVVQIWPGQTVTCLHTNSPGHIWAILYLKNLLCTLMLGNSVWHFWEKKRQLKLCYLQLSYLYVTFVVSCFSSPEGLAVLYNTRGWGGVGFLVPANLNNFHPSAHKSLDQELAKEIVYRQVVRESFSLDPVWSVKIQFYLYCAPEIGRTIIHKMKDWEMFSVIDKQLIRQFL